MTPEDVTELADVIAEIVNAVVAPIKAQNAALQAKLAVLEGKVTLELPSALAAVAAQRGEKGLDGKDAEPVDYDAVVARVVALIPPPKDGRDGKDADVDTITSALRHELKAFVDDTVAMVAPAITEQAHAKIVASLPDLVRAEVERVAASIPTPADGRDGKDADPDLVRAEVAKAVAALPIPRDGKDGRDGVDGVSPDPASVAALVRESVEKAVAALPTPKDGRDGVSVADALVSHDGELVMTFSDGRVKPVGVVVGKQGDPGRNGTDGINGKDGVDGLGFDDFEEETEDDGRIVVRRYRRGDYVKEFRHKTAAVIYRGIWQDGQTYEKGDSVTWAGAQWIAREATTAKPDEHGTGARAWQLSVKRGRDGKSGPQGPAGPQGLRGEKGDRGPDRW